MLPFSEPPSLAFHVTLLILVAAAAVQIGIGLWAATSRGHWFWRATLVWAAVALLLPIRAYEPALVFAICLPLIIALIQCSRWARRRLKEPLASQQVRFGLSDLLLVVLILGLSLAAGRHVAAQSVEIAWIDIVVPALGLTLVAIVSYAAASSLWSALRTTATLKSAVQVTALLVILFITIPLAAWFVWPRLKWLSQLEYFGLGMYYVFPSSEQAWEVFQVTCLGLAELAIGLLIATLLVWSSRRPTRSRGRVLSRVASSVVAVPVLAVLLVLYWQMLWFVPPPPDRQPVGNNYERIMAIAQRVKTLNPAEGSISDLRALAGSTAAADELDALFAELLPLLDRENAIYLPVERYTIGYLSSDGMSSARALSRSLAAETKAALARGDDSAAVRFARANIRLGTMLCQGGLYIDILVGHAILHRGFRDVLEIRHRLPASDARALVRDLARLEAEHDPFTVSIARDVAYCQRAMGWTASLGFIIQGWLFGPPEANDSSQWIGKSAQRWAAISRLLATDLALADYQTDHGRLPPALDDLVPAYLPALPLDPFSGQPLLYRPSGDTFILYSVSHDGRDDGGRLTNWQTFISGDGYDFDLGTLTRP